MTAIFIPLHFIISFSSALFPCYWWEQDEMSNVSVRVGSSPGHVGIVSFLHTIHTKEIHALPMLFFLLLLFTDTGCKL